jgi:hypothetical protein
MFRRKSYNAYLGWFLWVWCQNIQKKSIYVSCKNIMSVLIQCFVKNYSKYMDNDFTMFGPKSLAELCLRETNVFPDVLAPNICQCLQWFAVHQFYYLLQINFTRCCLCCATVLQGIIINAWHTYSDCGKECTPLESLVTLQIHNILPWG